MLITAYVLTALIAAGLIFIGARFLLVPRAAAAGYGVPTAEGAEVTPYLAVKGDRDIGFGLVTIALLIAAPAHALGWFLVAGASMPLADMLIVLRNHGPRATAYGVHGATAAVMLAIAAVLLLA
jgi:hypothetical protein